MYRAAGSRTRVHGDARPAFFDLLRIRFPVGAVASILHRVSGVLLAVALPVAIYLFDLSLRGPRGYARAGALLDALPSRAAAVLVVWALSHHLLAGLRHLLMDLDVGSDLATARRTAWTANLAGVALGILAAVAVL